VAHATDTHFRCPRFSPSRSQPPSARDAGGHQSPLQLSRLSGTSGGGRGADGSIPGGGLPDGIVAPSALGVGLNTNTSYQLWRSQSQAESSDSASIRGFKFVEFSDGI